MAGLFLSLHWAKRGLEWGDILAAALSPDKGESEIY